MKIERFNANNFKITGLSYHGENFKKLTSCPDKGRFSNGLFLFVDSFTNIDYFLKEFPCADWLGDAEVKKDKLLLQKEKEIEMAKTKPQDIDFDSLLFKYSNVFKTKPFDHQLKAFVLSKNEESYGLFFEQGCGKTKVIIDNAVYLYQNKKIDSLIIIAPNGVHRNWIDEELPIHCIEDFDSFCWQGKRNKTTMKKIDEVNKSKKLKTFAFNIECFTSDKNKKMFLDILSNNRSMVVVDESQGIKNPKAKRTKFLVDVSKKNKNILYKRILSGTPVTKGVEDLFSQFNFLNSNILGLNSYYAFTARYCKTQSFNLKNSNRQYSKIIGYQKMDELQEKIDTYTYRVLKKDCLDLPEKLYQREFYTLTPEQLRIEEEIREEGVSYIKECLDNNEPVIVENILARLTKRQQIICGYLLNINDKKVVELVEPEKNPRLLKLKEILSRISGKVIIWARFTQDINYIMKILGDKAVRYDGLVGSDQKEENKLRFQKDDSVRYFVAKPIKGLTLTAATTAIYYSNDFDLEKRQQSEDRNHRFGTKEIAHKEGVDSILYIDIQAQNSIDGKIITALRTKKKISDMILQDPISIFMGD